MQDILVKGFQGEVPALDIKALPEMAASGAVNCDFKSGVLKSLPAYKSSTVSGQRSRMFFLSDTNPSVDMKAYLGSDNFHGVPAPVINDERVVFVFNDGSGPKKARHSDISGCSGEGYCTSVNNQKDLGVPQPSETLEIEKEATYTDYSASKIYYKDDIVHIHDQGDLYQSLLLKCISNNSIGHLFGDDGVDLTGDGVWDKDINKSNWTWIQRMELIHNRLSTSSDGHYGLGRGHEKVWILDESDSSPYNWTKNTSQVMEKGDLLHYRDGHVYRAKYNNINRNRPDDPDCWNFLINFTEFIEAVNSMENYNILPYIDTKVYAAGEICLRQIGNKYIWFICNVNGTQGVDPIGDQDRWAILWAWNTFDLNVPDTLNFNSSHGIILPYPVPGGSTVSTMLPYLTHYPAPAKNPHYAVYHYIDTGGDSKWGIFQVKRPSSNIRPFNPEFGGENPWEIYKTKDEIAIDRSEVYDTVSYTYTWITAWGEESKPAKPTEVIDANMAEIIKVRKPIARPSSHITGFRLYRLSGGMESSEFLFFPKDGNIEDGDFSHDHDDWIKDGNDYWSHVESASNLGEAIPTEGWDEPKSDLTGFVSLANGSIAGFRKNEIYFSEPWVYYAYPEKYQVTTQSRIVGLGAFHNTIVACTQAKPEIISCPTPGQVDVKISPNALPCKSADSIVSAENYVLYAGHDGIVHVGQDGIGQVMTRKLINEDIWRKDFKPEDIAGAYYDGQYWGVIKGTKQGFVLPFNNPEHITMLDVNGTDISEFTGITVCPYTGSLYLIGTQGSNTYVLIFGEDGDSFLPWQWTSKLFTLNKLINYSAFKIDGSQDETDSVRLIFKGDGQEILDRQVTSDNPQRMPVGRYRNALFTLEGAGEVKVNFVKFSTSMESIQA